METHAHTLREIAEQSHPGETREALLSAATVIDRQAARIRELEGALLECADVLEDSLYPGSRFGRIDTQDGGGALYSARRILAEGGKP